MQRNDNEPEKQTNKQAHALTEENKRVVRRERRRRYAWRTARRLRAASARLPAAPRNWAPRWDQVRGPTATCALRRAWPPLNGGGALQQQQSWQHRGYRSLERHCAYPRPLRSSSPVAAVADHATHTNCTAPAKRP
ncbi:hypothetical protein HPB50_001519 [Hyalomma asiaticum]|uniref:Uncharacterized protein n=1 Tax=Hyalomma asiaticum TaxID=266040 RepID=A0ACB7SJT2_HYAAI|nr:hypothetical protein HPB50_001519 [Hyalomma asiaticum]